MPDPFTIYRQHADQYERLVSYEDYEHQLPAALSAIRSFERADVVEWGAGTGRVSELIAPNARSIIACDLNDHMLHLAAAKYRRFEHLKWQTVVMDHRRAPLRDRVADISIAGWTLGYLGPSYCGDRWQEQIRQAINQMQRVLRPVGTLIIIETLGTGETVPTPPTDWLAEYYHFLEHQLDFHATSIRTDFKFDSLEQAASLISFFFGGDWADKVRHNNWIILPECTGIWWKQAAEWYGVIKDKEYA
ncbi:MAG TPA: class I SAM-dependent methyltransferase [Anaerolineae bacterium]|nr:class I SAM-dependent methyltransferase [Anaerolineae bacterium]